MDHIGTQLEVVEKNIELNTSDSIIREGFTQVPNFILKNGDLTVGEKITFAMFLSYAWHNNFCFPGQGKLAEDIGVTRQSVNSFIKGLEKKGFLEIKRRGLGKTNLYKVRYVVQKKKK